MKKICVIAALALLLLLGACGVEMVDDRSEAAGEQAAVTPENQPAEDTLENEIYEIALIVDIDFIGDQSYSQSAWNSISQYAEQNDLTCQYYTPDAATTDGYAAAIDTAVNSGARLVICPGAALAAAVYQKQYAYPDVFFVLLDDEPHSTDYAEEDVNRNVLAVRFDTEQAGFLAGYAAVKSGLTQLGFIGGMAIPETVAYGYGFIAGAEYAALEVERSGIEISYAYSGSQEANADTQTLAASWYANNVDLIFAAGGNMAESVIAAAAQVSVIAADYDRGDEAKAVVNSAVKLVNNVVADQLAAYTAGTFSGGKSVTYGAAESGVGLAMNNNRLTDFTEANYKVIYTKLAAGSITLPDPALTGSAAELSDANVTVTLVE